MLQLSGSILNKHILSLRTGGVIAHVLGPIINPNNLKIEGFYCLDRFSRDQLVLLVQDIRENGPKGYIVNDHEVLTQAEDLIRLKDILKINFVLQQKPVVTSNKNKLGKINDYAFDNENMYIQKLYVGQSLLKSLSGGQLSIDRDQIIEITNRKIVVQEPLKGVRDRIGAVAPATS